MRSSPLVCIGHSHTEAVAAAAAERQVPLLHFNFWYLGATLERDAGVVRLPPHIRAHLSGTVFSFVGGGAHMDYGMIVHPRPYDFVLPSEPDLPLAEGAETVPYDALYASLAANARSVAANFSVKQMTDQILAHIGLPASI